MPNPAKWKKKKKSVQPKLMSVKHLKVLVMLSAMACASVCKMAVMRYNDESCFSMINRSLAKYSTILLLCVVTEANAEFLVRKSSLHRIKKETLYIEDHLVDAVSVFWTTVQSYTTFLRCNIWLVIIQEGKCEYRLALLHQMHSWLKWTVSEIFCTCRCPQRFLKNDCLLVTA